MGTLFVNKPTDIWQGMRKSDKYRLSILFVCFVIYKLFCDWGYWELLTFDTDYKMSFDALKYANGLVWCMVLFMGIRHNQHKVSTFMLYLVLLVQIVPITTIYALGNDSAEYYNALCVAYLACEILTGWAQNGKNSIHSRDISGLLMLGMVGMYLLLLIVLVVKNGKPSLMALNIYKVYELRSSGSFDNGGKYMGYIMTWCMQAVAPFFLAMALQRKRYLLSLLLCGAVFLIYLYCGYKSYLFFIPMCVICALWTKREKCYFEIFSIACVGFAVLVLLACYAPVGQSVFKELYSLLGRRVLMCPASAKFIYFDFFSQNPKLGLGGFLPRWLINVHTAYDNITIPTTIASIYFGRPEEWFNTGFLAEGYMRFGHLGTFLILGLFALVLRVMDHMQRRVGYPLTVAAFVYPVLILSDDHLFDSMVFGPWMVIVIIAWFYCGMTERRMQYSLYGNS